MNMLPSVLIDKELRVSDFKLSSEFFENFSFLFYGFELKSEYDNKRHSIHKSLKPKKFAHLVKTKNGMDFKFFYGVILKGNKVYSNNNITNINSLPSLIMGQYNIFTDNKNKLGIGTTRILY